MAGKCWSDAGPVELQLHALGQAADDEVVGVLDHVAHEALRQAAVDRDGVPVALVEVPSRLYGCVRGAQLDGELRLALEADRQRLAAQEAQGEHLPGDL